MNEWPYSPCPHLCRSLNDPGTLVPSVASVNHNPTRGQAALLVKQLTCYGAEEGFRPYDSTETSPGINTSALNDSVSCAVLRRRWLKPYTCLVDRHTSLCFLVRHVLKCSVLLPRAWTFSSSVFKISCLSVDESIIIYYCQTRWNIWYVFDTSFLALICCQKWLTCIFVVSCIFAVNISKKFMTYARHILHERCVDTWIIGRLKM
jgi:hypothetical protein